MPAVYGDTLYLTDTSSVRLAALISTHQASQVPLSGSVGIKKAKNANNANHCNAYRVFA